MVLYVFIVNTNAGNGKAILAWNRVEVILTSCVRSLLPQRKQVGDE